jgi:deoxyribodipyrimidine photo-lyase
MPNRPTLVWLRQDLRLQDNAAFHAALANGGPIIPVYVLAETGAGRWAPGVASRWWLHGSLETLARSLETRGTRLILRRGDSATELRALARETGAAMICWNRAYEPEARAEEAAVRRTLAADGIEIRESAGGLLFEPAAIRNQAEKPFQVFTPFWRHCLTQPVPVPLALPAGRWPPPKPRPRSDVLEDWALRMPPGRTEEFRASGTPGEEGGQRCLAKFIAQAMDDYQKRRDVPAVEGTSRLSPHLHFGELTPRQIWAAVEEASRTSGVMPRSRGAFVFLGEVGWREFAHHLLWHFPHSAEAPLRPEYGDFPWRRDEAVLRAWQQGRTGYPIVDAGMRQLRRTGWMHNRVRMIVASFLVKQLLQPWSEGAAWFWDTLVDADLANNTLGWQWSAGCGADAAPYFRIFNPVLQGEKFDPAGDYVRRWVPELARVPAETIHQPWSTAPLALAAAGVALGHDYPHPIIAPGEGRARALAALAEWKQKRAVTASGRN